MTSVRGGTFRPKDADEYVTIVAVRALEMDSVLWMAEIKSGDQDQLRKFTRHLARYRMDAFERLEEAG
jgi:hypothetical protein